MSRAVRRTAGVVLCIVLLSSMAVAPVAAQSDAERFLVELDAEGDAAVSVTFVYDLDGEDEAAAFEALRENATARAQASERFETRMAAVAADANEATDREMSVRDASVELRRDGETGIVSLSLGWSNLAAVEGDRLTVSEPFASGFELERTVAVVAPDGYAITSATPEPTHDEGTSVTWNADTTLENFEVVAEADADESGDGGTQTAPDGGSAEDSPGFGVVTAVLALFAATLLAIRRFRS